jgi:hypothetical protein
MKELARTNDVVRLSWAQALLQEAGIGAIVLDAFTSIVEGSIGAIPRRLMVADDDHFRARTLLAEAEARLRERDAKGDAMIPLDDLAGEGAA